MAEAEGGSEQDDVSFLRTEDMVCLQCTATGERVCLAAEGFGNRTCFLENIADKNVPPDLSTCVFVIEQALSVRALQELVTAAAEDPEAKQGTSGSGHRTLLYGNAVLLRHMNSGMYLACLSTSSSSDKLAFDVGLQEHSQGEACWWTIHPASKQRSEGEKVRVGDDLILVSVATERYLHTARDKERVIVNASFHVTHWSVAPYGTGISRLKYVGCVFGGDVLRFFHGGDECLTIPSSWSEMPGRNIVVYEGGAVVSQARSLWRLELARTKWSGGFINWSHPMRIRHITTGRYLAVQTGTSLGGSLRADEAGGGMGSSNVLVLVSKEEATLASSTFFLRQEKDDQKIMLEDKDLEIIGAPLIRYGDTTVILQHVESGLWLSYRSYETKVKGVGKVEEKQAILHEEGKMDDGLEFSRSQVEESRTARVIRTCGNLFNTFIKNLNTLQTDRRHSNFIQTMDLNEMIMCLEDLINYFAQPEDDIGHEERQVKLRALRNRQDLFQEEGILNLILDAIDKINQITSQGYLVALAGDEAGQQWDVISGYLYQLLAAVIKGNHTNCAQFAQLHRLNWLFSRLGSQASGEGSGMLDVLHCILIDSPEALNMMTEEHIKVIISLLEKHGRDPKVLDVLCSLCVGNGVAVRSSQNNICDYLLPGRDLLLQTQLVDHVSSVQPNIYLGKVQGSTMYQRWYFEVIVDYIEQTSHMTPHLRIGWANTTGYIPYPGGGEKWGGNGVGDDLYSYGFDGEYLWTGGQSTGIHDPRKDPPIQAGDIIGCALDLQDCKIIFSYNGAFLRGHFANFNLDGMFFPVISCSAKISCRFLFGGNEGKLRHRPPEGFSPLVESLQPNQVLKIEPCFYFGDLAKNIICGPTAILEDGVFVPKPVDTAKVVLPGYVEKISEKLAENIHEVWAMGKIEQGWIYGDVRDDVDMTHPCLCKFELLPQMEKSYNVTMAVQTLRTILALGYHISLDKPPSRIKAVHLPKDPFLQPNGYKPAPLDLQAAQLTPRLEKLVEELAQNTHNVWSHERVLRGWTYGVTEDPYGKRSPHLVPYGKLDPEIREANIQTASEAIQTLIVYGYIIEPPSGDPSDTEVGPPNPFMADTRTYRAEKTYAVSAGKWYYEFEVLTAGPMRVGWAKINMPPGICLGSDENSWGFDGFNEEKIYGGSSETYGKQWQVGDIVGVMLDLVDKTISFSLNGELMMDSMGGETAFTDITGEGFVPAFTYGVGQKAKIVFGQDIQQLKFFTSCGLQEGYQPFCVNMKRSVTLWYNKELPMFENVDDVAAAEADAGGLFNPNLGTAIEVTRIPAGSDSPPSLKISHKYFETMEKATWEFLRLSLPIRCQNNFIDESEKSRRWQEIRVRQQKLKMERPTHYQDQSASPLQLYGGYGDPEEQHGEGIEADEGLLMTASGGMLMQQDPGVLQVPHEQSRGRTPSPGGRMNRAHSEQALTMTERAAMQADPMQPAQDDKASRRGLSPLRFFKRMRDQSKERRRRAKTPDAGMAGSGQGQPTERFTPMALANKVRAKGKAMMQHPGFHITGQGQMPAAPPRKHSLVGKGKQTKVDDGADLFDKYCLDRMDEYFIGFRIFPGQDPNLVYVGWVSTLYHVAASAFNPAQMRKAQAIGDDLVSHDRNNCWLVKAADLYNEVTRTESGDAGGGKSASQGMFIGCTLDTVTGYASFYCDGKLTQTKFKMLPGAKLFPAIFVEATSKEMLQVELGRTQTTLPFSSAILRNSEKSIQPQMPPRLKVQVLRQYHWARVPNIYLKVHSLKLSDVRGWSMLCEDAVPMLALHLPEEDRCIDILEVIESERLLNFHAQTLVLYCALCYQSNYRAAHTLCSHVDQKQLLYAIQADYMSGPLRTGFYDLLISLHLESFAETRAQTSMEFLVPLSDELKELYGDPAMGHSLHSVATGSIRPQMTMCEITDTSTDIRDLSCPYVDLDILKTFTIDALEDAVATNQVHVRDQIGGSNANLFVPILKLCDKLLLIGLFEDEDIMRILIMIDPGTWDPSFDREGKDEHRVGLLQMKVAEGVKLQLCYILQHLHDIQLRHRIESLICFSEDYVKKIQAEQIRRYIEIKASDLPSAVAAKKTREFRCPPREQMNINLGFKNLEEEECENCPAGPELKEELISFHDEYMAQISVPKPPEEEGSEEGGGSSSTPAKPGMFSKIRHFFSVAAGNDEPEPEEVIPPEPLLEENFKKVLIPTIVGWAKQDHIEDSDLVREMFSLLLRQYNGVGEVMAAIENTYVFHGRGSDDVAQLLEKLSRVRSLLPVQMSLEEEKLVRGLLWEMVRNRVFFQHPDLMRTLHVHENVMAIMMNTLGRQAQQSDAQQQPQEGNMDITQMKAKEDSAPDMVVSCCRFLCYFCRASGANQRAMFEHLSFLIENSNILLSRPSLRGTAPLDVAYSAFMDNTELALALREHYLEKIAVYLSRCGLQSNSELVAKGYPDIGWDPVEGERYLDFLRFCVWVSGESVEENANLVIRLLIRRPECLGPALRGEGEGLLSAIMHSNQMSEQISLQKNGGRPEAEALFTNHPMPESEEDEDWIDTGAAILNFYCTLVDLLGRCAPDQRVIDHGKNEALRARAILRSLVPLEDLIGVLSLKFQLGQAPLEDGRPAPTDASDIPSGLTPRHKQSVVLFLERVYGIEEKELFYRILEEAFLPDLRAATMLDKGDGGESEMALALNRYIGNSILPTLISHHQFYVDAEQYSSLLDASLHTVYKLSKSKILTKGQREAVSDFLLALTREMQPSMLLKLLRKLTVDVSQLSEYTTVALRLLTLHFERCGRYYGAAGGQGSYGSASEEEKRLTMILFQNIFDSLAKTEYNPALFSSSLPCLIAIGCALPPDYTLTTTGDDDLYRTTSDAGPYIPQPIQTAGLLLSNEMENLVQTFSEHYHDAWAARKMEAGWTHGDSWNDQERLHPRLKPYHMLSDYERERYREPIRDALKALIALNWNIEYASGEGMGAQGSSMMGMSSGHQAMNIADYHPSPADMTNLTLSKEMQNMAERLAEDAHDIWAKKKKHELDSCGGVLHQQLVPYDLLTDKEKRKDRERANELLKYLQYMGYKLRRSTRQTERNLDALGGQGSGGVSVERRFAYTLLEKLLRYLDHAAVNMKIPKPSRNFSRRNSFRNTSTDVTFFNKVVMPLIEKYFVTHRQYFITVASATVSSGAASLKEKEMVAALFCRLSNLLRSRSAAFGSNAQLCVKCLQVLVRGIDAKSLAKNCPEFIRTSMLNFFNCAAHDLSETIVNLEQKRVSHILGTHLKTCSSLNYVYMVLLPVLSTLYDHLASNDYGADLLVGDVQVASYKILGGLFTLGKGTDLTSGRKFIINEFEVHRPAIGSCLGAFAAAFPVAFLEPALAKNNPNSIHGKAADHSLEAQDVLAQLETSLPTLEKILAEISDFSARGGKHFEAPHVIDLYLPMLCAYLPYWWTHGPDNANPNETGGHLTTVTSEHMNHLLKSVLNLIKNNIGVENCPWMIRIAYSQQIIINASETLLADPYLPLSRKVKQQVQTVFHKEESMKGLLKSTTEDTSQVEAEIQDEWNLVVRDLYAFYPMLIKYVDLQRSHWLKHPSDEAEELYKNIAEIFNIWSKSLFFMKEEHSFVSQHEIDNMTLIMPTASGRRGGVVSEPSSSVTASKSAKKKKKKKTDKDREKDKEKGKGSSLIVACLKRLLPVGLNLFAGRQQELVQHCKDKLLQKEAESDVQDFAKMQLTLPDKIDPSDEMSWQHILYAKLGTQHKENGVTGGQNGTKAVSVKLTPSQQTATLELTVSRIVAMAKVLFGLHTIDHPQTEAKGATRKVMTPQRKKAVIQCFRQVSLHSLPSHRAINLLLMSYSGLWLSEENVGQEKVIEDLTLSFEEAERLKKELSEEEGKPDPVTTLVRVFCHGASSEHSQDISSDDLYMKYAEIMGRSCGEEEEEGEGEEEGEASIAEQEMQKQLLLFCQSRLASRGVAEMVLLYISACKGQQSDLVVETLKLGISILRGGNIDIQRSMLNHLKETKDVGFFTSIAGLMNSCTVLDLDAFERNTKAEGLGGGPDGAAGQKNMHDSDFTCVLFRFIQLTCEGHNLDWQNYLRTQAGNTTTVNVVICTVDYLLRLQESIMDFYWHYSSKELIDASGKANFFKAIGVASQVFNTLTEVIQGPCVQNQQALAHSRLWDAVGGFMFLFAHMQDKLSKHSSQIDLLTELMNLQKDMVVMMLSMLEGNVVNGTIGKQMVDTLVESASNVEMILKFFDMFLKLKDLTSSPSFQELDKDSTGWITLEEFKEKMEQQMTYAVEEIDYILGCCEANVDGKINYIEFTEQFHNPAKEIGFNFAVLLTNLSEHMPSDARLSRFLETAGSVLNYFENVLGRIEICSGHKIERVYFEIDEDNIEQWEKPQIKESKRAFFYSIVTEGGDKEKLEAFVNFCEDAIFEMQHAASLMGESDSSQPTKAQAYTYSSPDDVPEKTPREKIWDGIKAGFVSIFGIFFLLSPSNIRKVSAEIKQMTPAEMVVGFFQLILRMFMSSGKFGLWCITSSFGVLMTLMKGPPQDPTEAVQEIVEEKTSFKTIPTAPPSPVHVPPSPPPTALPAIMPAIPEEGGAIPAPPPEGSMPTTTTTDVAPDGSSAADAHPQEGSTLLPGISSMLGVSMAGPEEDTMATEEAIAQQQALLAAEEQAKAAGKESSTAATSGATPASGTDEPPPVAQINVGDYTKRVLSFLGRNFYNLKYLALILAFCINFMLLFYRVSTSEEEGGEDGSGEASLEEILNASAEGDSSGEATSGEMGDGDDDDVLETVQVDEKYFYIDYVVRLFALLHSLISVAMLIAYYHLKVPLAIFKREKEIARRLEFEGLWITGQPDDDDIKSHWDKLVISSRSFPVNYWDKFVKKKVRQKYSETYDFDSISVLLGMEKTSSFAKAEEESTGVLSFITGIDWRYQVWKAGVTVTDSSFQYSLFYFTFSVLGNFNYFFFAAHLLDVAVGFKTLRTILQSVTHNGKQLVLTLLLLTIVVYIYTVIAFNFFRKFYVQEEDEEVDQKCHDMLTCFVFHLYKGVRAGGGIGDEIESPDGDDYEVYRIIFDITFFFFVIVILLAIIQGLIIDAFGELRDQLQSVQDDMESNCFICGIGKDYFDKIPHGFDTHVQKEHNLANYMFFLMYLISKPDTEYTGQETYVWNMYTQRCWDFFPVGDCFRKQYEDELSGTG